MLMAVGQIMAASSFTWTDEDLLTVLRLGMPVWLRFLESCFFVLICHAMAVHEHARSRELRRITGFLFKVTTVLAVAIQAYWYYIARDMPDLSFQEHVAERIFVGWEMLILGLGIYLAVQLKPEIKVLPALTVLAGFKALYMVLIHLRDFTGTSPLVNLVEWSGGGIAALLLLIAAHVGIVTETFTDPLTRLHNRRYFMMRVKEEFDRATRRNAPVAVLVMDLDFFKRFNDTQGHIAGDTMLKSVARLLNKHLRPYDVLCRWGGEEFIALLPDTDAETGFQVAERLRLSVEELFGGADRRSPITISIGLATYPDVPSGDWRHVVEAADEALYKAKEKRNSVWVHVPA